MNDTRKNILLDALDAAADAIYAVLVATGNVPEVGE